MYWDYSQSLLLIQLDLINIIFLNFIHCPINNRLSKIQLCTCIEHVRRKNMLSKKFEKNMRTSENAGGLVKSQYYWSGRLVKKKVKGKPCLK